jgi:dCTP deaminase
VPKTHKSHIRDTNGVYILGKDKATNPGLICFVDGKSTRARTCLLVHLTAPTIHAGWRGKIVLKIANLGPFHFVLQENDVIAQLTVAMVVSPPDLTLKTAESATAGQRHVTGRPITDQPGPGAA